MTSYNKNEPETIRSMFNSIAQSYDRTNAVLSFQMHKIWNAALVRQAVLSSNPDVYLDLCSGTGAIAFEFLHKTSSTPKVYLLDFSEEMLAYAQDKARSQQLEHHDLTFLQADAQVIPLPDNYVDCATIAYGIRNVMQPQDCINEVYRVLKPNGTFGILELTQPSNALLRLGHGIYLRTVLPLIGKILTSNKEAYNYLCNSIHTFIPPEEIERLMQNAGFKNIKKTAFCKGVATILIGNKTQITQNN